MVLIKTCWNVEDNLNMYLNIKMICIESIYFWFWFKWVFTVIIGQVKVPIQNKLLNSIENDTHEIVEVERFETQTGIKRVLDVKDHSKYGLRIRLMIY